MSCKDMCCQLLTSFDWNMADESFLFLFPEQRNASSDLNETVQMLIVSKNELTFNEVGYIWIIINTSRDKSSAGMSMPSTWDQHNIYFLSIEYLRFLLNISLNYWNRPKWINILKIEILYNFVIPLITLVKRFVILYGSLSLLAARDVSVIRVVKSLFLQYLFYSVNVFHNFLGHV